MEGLGVLVFVIIAILAAFSNARKAGQGTGAPRPRGTMLPRTGQPFPRTPGDLPAPQRGDAPPVLVAGRGLSAEEESAASLVPDDLWAILTGERRAPMRSPQRPLETPRAPTPPGIPPRRSVTEPVSLEAAGLDERRRQEELLAQIRQGDVEAARSAELAPTLLTVAPAVTVAVPAAGPSTGRPEAAPAAPRRRRGLISGPGDLRRAFVLQMVLGKPKALE